MVTRILALSSSALATISVITLAALPAAAATTMGSGAVNAAVDTGTSMTTGTGGTGTSVNAFGNTGSSSTSGSAGVNVTGSSNTGTIGTNGTSGDMTGSSQAGSDDTTSIMLSNTDQSVMNYANSTDSQMMSDPSMVTTHDQLNAYAEGTMHSDSNIKNVQMSNTAVTMDYQQPARLFGFIPVTMTTEAQANQDGTVTVKYPWYHFLVSDSNPNLQSDLQTRVKASIGNSTTSLSDQMRAEIMADLYAGFKGSV